MQTLLTEREARRFNKSFSRKRPVFMVRRQPHQLFNVRKADFLRIFGGRVGVLVRRKDFPRGVRAFPETLIGDLKNALKNKHSVAPILVVILNRTVRKTKEEMLKTKEMLRNAVTEAGTTEEGVQNTDWIDRAHQYIDDY